MPTGLYRDDPGQYLVVALEEFESVGCGSESVTRCVLGGVGGGPVPKGLDDDRGVEKVPMGPVAPVGRPPGGPAALPGRPSPGGGGAEAEDNRGDRRRGGA